MKLSPRGWRCGWAIVLLLGLAGAVHAQPEPPAQPAAPTRVGRIAAVSGDVKRFDQPSNQWLAVARNRPLMQGERLLVGPGGSAELQIGASALRLAGDT